MNDLHKYNWNLEINNVHNDETLNTSQFELKLISRKNTKRNFPNVISPIKNYEPKIINLINLRFQIKTKNNQKDKDLDPQIIYITPKYIKKILDKKNYLMKVNSNIHFAIDCLEIDSSDEHEYNNINITTVEMIHGISKKSIYHVTYSKSLENSIKKKLSQMIGTLYCRMEHFYTSNLHKYNHIDLTYSNFLEFYGICKSTLFNSTFEKIFVNKDDSIEELKQVDNRVNDIVQKYGIDVLLKSIDRNYISKINTSNSKITKNNKLDIQVDHKQTHSVINDGTNISDSKIDDYEIDYDKGYEINYDKDYEINYGKDYETGDFGPKPEIDTTADIKLFRFSKKELKIMSYRKAISHDNVKRFSYLVNKNYDEFDFDPIQYSIEKNSIEVLHHILTSRNKYDFSYYAKNNCYLDLAITLQNVQILRILNTNGITMCEHHMIKYATQGNLSKLKFAHENGCPNDYFAMAMAVKYDHLDCIQYMIDNKFLCDITSFKYAIAADKKKALKLLMSCKLRLDYAITSYAYQLGRYKCFKILISGNVPYDKTYLLNLPKGKYKYNKQIHALLDKIPPFVPDKKIPELSKYINL
jgi:hypothetical protein